MARSSLVGSLSPLNPEHLETSVAYEICSARQATSGDQCDCCQFGCTWIQCLSENCLCGCGCHYCDCDCGCLTNSCLLGNCECGCACEATLSDCSSRRLNETACCSDSECSCRDCEECHRTTKTTLGRQSPANGQNSLCLDDCSRKGCTDTERYQF